MRLPDELPADPADIHLNFQAGRWLTGLISENDGERGGVTPWHVTIEHVVYEDAAVRRQIGSLHLYAVNWDACSDIQDALDALGGDLHAIGEQILDGSGMPLDDELVIAEQFIIVDCAELVPEWRGFGLGRLITAVALKQLSAGTAFAALIAAPVTGDAGRPGTAKHKAAAVKIAAGWEILGFERFRETDVHILDMSTTALDDAIKDLKTRFGISR